MEVDVSKGIEVGSFHYEVLQDSETEKDLEADSSFGKCDNQHRRIKITMNYAGEQFSNTFVHECVEAVNSNYCNNLLKHSEITNLSNGLTQLLKSLGIQFVYACKIGGSGEK